MIDCSKELDMLRLYFFGTPVVTFNDQSLGLTRSATQISLFAFLVSHRDRPQSRSVLAAMFWPDLPDARARRNLNNALWELRDALKMAGSTDPYLLSDGQTVQFNSAAPVWLDVAEFETITAVLQQIPKPGGTFDDEITRRLNEAANLYRGDFLEGIYADWCIGLREQFREQYLLILEKLVQAYRAREQYAAALRSAQQLALVEPMHEEAHFQLIQLCALQGRLHEARTCYQRYKTIWRDELKSEPSHRMKALIQQIEYGANSEIDSSADEALARDLLLVIDSFASLRDLPEPRNEEERLWHERTWEQIAEAGERAARAFRARYANSEALRYFTVAADALSSLPDSRERNLRELVVRRERDELLDLSADRKGQAENLERADQLAEKLGEPKLRAELLARRAWLIMREGRYPQAIALLQQMLRLCQAENDEVQEALAYRLLGVAYSEIGDYRAALERHAQALSRDEAAKLNQSIYLDLNNLAEVLTAIGSYSAALSKLERAQTLMPLDATLLARATIAGNIGNLFVKLGRFDMAADQLTEAMNLARRAGDREVECWLGGRLSTLYQRRRETNRALVMAYHYYQVALEINGSLRMTELADLLTSLYCEGTDGKRALEWADRTYELAHTNGYWRYRLRSAMRQSQALLLLSEIECALEGAQRAVAEFEERGQVLEEEPELFYTLAQCAQTANDAQVAATAYARAREALLRQADLVVDADQRQQFLDSRSLHHAILATQITTP
jgi:DNA-binding SARP family transcriptional activator